MPGTCILCGAPTSHVNSKKCAACIEKMSTVCEGCGKKIKHFVEKRTHDRYCGRCLRKYDVERIKKTSRSIDALFSDKKLPVEYKKDVIENVEKYIGSHSIIGYSLEEIVKEIAYITIKQKTAISCPVILAGVKHQTSKQWAMSRELGIRPRNGLVIPKYIVTALKLEPGEVSDLKQVLADRAIVKLAQGKSSIGVLAAIIFIYLRNKSDKFI